MTGYRLSRARGRVRTRTGLIHLVVEGRHRALCGTHLPSHTPGVAAGETATCPRCLRLAAKEES